MAKDAHDKSTEEVNIEIHGQPIIKEEYEYDGNDDGLYLSGQLLASIPDFQEIVTDYENTANSPKQLDTTQPLQRMQLECDETYWRLAKSFDNKLNASIDPEIAKNIQEFNRIIHNQNLEEQAKEINILAAKIKGELVALTQDEDIHFFIDEAQEKLEEARNPKYAHYKQLCAFDEMCTQLRIQLKLREAIKEWSKHADNPTKLKQEVDKTLDQMAPDLLNAHPDTVKFANRCFLEATGWMEARQLMEEYKNLQKIIGIKRYIPMGPKRELWKKKRQECFNKIQKIANELGSNVDDLWNYTKLLDYNARRPFSLEWFTLHLQEANPHYFDAKTQQLTPEGINYVERILSEATNPYLKELALPKKIVTEDLVLLVQYLGRDNVEKYCKLFALQGDGSHAHPFTMDNLRVILIGMLSDRRAEFEPEHIKNLLNKVAANAHNPTVRLGSSPRLVNAMNNRMQNALPDNEDKSYHKMNVFYNFLRWAREYSYNVVDTSNERYAAGLIASGNPMFLLVVTVFSALTNAKIDNEPACAYSNCLMRVLANNPAPVEQKQYHVIGNEAAQKITNDVLACANYEDFSRLYPMFSEENAHAGESQALKGYFTFNRGTEVPEHIQNIIAKKVDDINKFKRAEKMAHEYAYLYVHEKENLTFHMQDRNLNNMQFVARNIIGPNHAELDVASTGWGVTFFTPPKTEVIHNNIVPLIIMFPGTHNQPGLLRDLDTRSPGKTQWSNPKYKHAFLNALNEEIARLKRDFGDDVRISIELLGHSLGGSDALQAELLILEAMGQNLLGSNPDLVNKYIHKIDAIFTEADQAELKMLKQKRTNELRIKELEYKKDAKEQLMQGLNSALGIDNAKRKYNTYDKDESREISIPLRRLINTDNIASVSTFCSRGAGMCEADAYATSALMGLLTDADTEIEEQVLNVEGDPLRYGGASKVFGASFVDPTLPAFQGNDKPNKLKVTNVQLNTGLGTKNGGILNVWAENNIAPLLAHVGCAFGGNPYLNSVCIRSAMDVSENKEYKNHVSGKWLDSESIFVRVTKSGMARGVLFVRIFLEVFARIFILKGIPLFVSTLLGSRQYDSFYYSFDTLYRSPAEQLRIKREKMHEYRRKPREILDETTSFDQQVISLSNLHHRNQLLQEHNSDASKVNKVLNTYLDNVIDVLPEFNELPGPEGEKIYTHIHHQYVKAKQYLHQWEAKRDKVPIENERELNRLNLEIQNQQVLVIQLEACFDGHRLNPEGCLQFIKNRAQVENNNQYIDDRNPKTLNLENKALMPLVMALQVQKLNELKHDKTTPKRERDRQSKLLKRAIGEYRKFIIDENYFEKRVMSSKWLQEKTESAAAEPFNYLQMIDDRFEITPKGLNRLEEIFNIARTQHTNNEAITPQDLALLGHFFGRRCVKRVMERYGLMGDGSELHQFNMDNVRALLLGAAALYNPDYVQGAPEAHVAFLLKTNETTLNLAFDPNQPVQSYLRIFDDFRNYEQNQLAVDASKDPLKFFRSLGRGFRRAYINSIVAGIKFVQNWGSSSLLAVPYTGDGGPVVRVLGATAVSGVVDMLTPENPPLSNFIQDLNVMNAIYLAKHETKAVETTPPTVDASISSEDAAENIFEAFSLCNKNTAEFVKKYPIFENDKQTFEYNRIGEMDDEHLKQFIKQRVEQVNDWGRAEKIANVHCMHLNAENDFNEKGYIEYNLPDKNGNVRACNMRTVTDTGVPHFRFNCYWPREKLNENEPITLMISIPEDIDVANIHKSSAPFTRLIALFRAGHYSLEDNANMEANRRADRARKKALNIPTQKYKAFKYLPGFPGANKARRDDAKIRIMQAINDEIDRIERVHGPNATINIELFGRGVAATNCLQMELYILEALAARKNAKEGKTDFNYNDDPNGHAYELNRGLKNGINRSLFRNQQRFPQLGHISGVTTYAFSAAGEPRHCARERAALVGYLARNPEGSDPGFSVVHNSFNVEGDPSGSFGQDHADRYLDINSKAFAGKPISINHCNTVSGRGLRNNNWFFNGFMKGNFDFGDLSTTAGRFTGPSCYNTNTTFLNNNSNKEMRAVFNEQTGHKNKNKFFSEVTASIGYHVRSSFQRLLFMPADEGERLLYRGYWHWTTLFIGKTVRETVYEIPFSSEYDADAHASKTEAKQQQKLWNREKKLDLHSTKFFKTRHEDGLKDEAPTGPIKTPK